MPGAAEGARNTIPHVSLRSRPGALEAALRGVFLAGRPGRRAAHALDLLASTGLRYAWRRRCEQEEIARVRPAPEDAIFGGIWSRAAAAAGAELEVPGGGFYAFRRGGATTRAWRHITPLDDAVTIRLALDKPMVQRLLRERGITVPASREVLFDDWATALDFVAAEPGPCVVKPSGLSGGSGVTCGVRGERELRRALVRASRLGRRVTLERQFPGDVYRLLFLDGELLDVIRRRPPTLVGDGESTLSELVAAENRRRIAATGSAGLTLLRVDLDAVLTLERAGIGLRTVPAAGSSVRLKTVTSQNRVEDNETVREGLSPQLVDEAAAASAVVGLRIAGVDLVTPDPGMSLQASGGAIVEVNGTPGLHYHYLVADPGAATDVAAPVLERMLS
jgi:D-alanine-D-alanine ligase-like ATP-grasp enzyme